jgi:hypothetical protein
MHRKILGAFISVAVAVGSLAATSAVASAATTKPVHHELWICTIFPHLCVEPKPAPVVHHHKKMMTMKKKP